MEQNTRVLVTGGAGFIGSHVVDALIAEGYQVTVIDNLSSGFRSNVPPAADFIELDIRKPAIRQVFAVHKFDVLVHAAAQMNVRQSIDDPINDAEINVLGMINLMEAGKANGLQRVIFTSSGGAAYDDDGPFPTPESVDAKPVSPYGISKVASEHYLKYYNRVFGIPYLTLRLGNVYGPRQNPYGEAGVVSIFSNLLLSGEQAFINGDGLQTRDFVYSGDVCSAVVAALKSSETGIYNVGTEVETNINELYTSIQRATNSSMGPLHKPAIAGEVRRSCMGIDKIQTELGWEPKVSLEDGIAATVAYFKGQLGPKQG